MTDGLSGERGFVDAEIDRFEQFSVGGHLFSRGEDDDVAHHDVFPWNGATFPFSDDLHRFFVVHAVEECELAFSLHFKIEAESCRKQNGDEDADRLEEDGSVFVEHEAFVECDADGECACDEEDDDERVREFAEIFLKKGFFFGRGENVLAVEFSALCHLCGGQSLIGLFA